MNSSSRFRPSRRASRPKAWDYVQRRRVERSRRSLFANADHAPHLVGTFVPSLDEITDHEQLLRVHRQLRREAGAAPGRDGVTYLDLSRAEEADLCRGLRDRVRTHSYRPLTPREIRISKGRGRGTRTLRLRGIMDRTLARSVKDALEPAVDAIFLPTSYGFRPRIQMDCMLAETVVDIELGKRVLINDDIRQAFDHVQLNVLINQLRDLGLLPDLLQLIETILGLQVDAAEQIGLEQGSPLSPLLLNIYLHFALDVQFAHMTGDVTLRRFADNLAVACDSYIQAVHNRNTLVQLLSAVGLDLKGEDGAIFDLAAGQTTVLLGVQLGWQDGDVRITLPGSVEDLFAETLEDLERRHSYPPAVIADCLRGWIRSLGPVFGNMEAADTCEQVVRTASHAGYYESVGIRELVEIGRSALQGWRTLLSGIRGQRVRSDVDVRPIAMGDVLFLRHA